MHRFIVERVSDGVFLDLDLPVEVSGVGASLNAPGQFSGTVAPDVGALRDGSGRLLIDPYATLIHEEADGVIRGSYLVTRSEVDGESWKVEGKGFSSFLEGRPFEGEFRGVREDAAAVARHVWVHAQSFAGANLGVTVKGTTGALLGTDSDLKVGAALTGSKNAKGAVDAAKAALKDKRAAAKSSPTPANKAAVTAAEAAVTAAEKAKTAADAALEKAKEQQSEDGGAWKILWWDSPDCFNAFTEAVSEAGHEWVEWSGWNADRSKILKEIRIVERVGRRQGSLAFVEGDNIIETVVVEDDITEYANTIVALGAGEGRSALRVTVGRADSRLRRVHVLDAKHVTKKAVLEGMARAELDRRALKIRVDAVRVSDHPNAEFGVFGVGDDILVDCDVAWLGRQQLWRRVVSVEFSDEFADLVLGDV